MDEAPATPRSDQDAPSYQQGSSFAGTEDAQAQWGRTQLFFAFLYHLSKDMSALSIFSPLCIVFESISFVWLASEWFLPSSIYLPVSLALPIAVMFLALSLLLALLLLASFVSFRSKSDVKHGIRVSYQRLMELVNAGSLVALHVGGAAVEHDRQDALIIAAVMAFVLMWIILCVVPSVLLVYPCNSVFPTLGSRIHNRHTALLCAAKLAMFFERTEIAPVWISSSIVAGICLVTAFYVLSMLPFHLLPANALMCGAMCGCVASSALHVWSASLGATILVVPTMLGAMFATVMRVFLIERRFRGNRIRPYMETSLPASMWTRRKSSDPEKGEAGNSEMDDPTEQSERRVELLASALESEVLAPFESARVVELRMRWLIRNEVQEDIICSIYEKVILGTEHAPEVLIAYGRFLLDLHTELEENRGRYNILDKLDDDPSERMHKASHFSKALLVLKEFRSRWPDMQSSATALRQRRLELDQTDLSREMALRQDIHAAEKYYAQGIALLSAFWKGVTKMTSDEIGGYIAEMQRIEKSGRRIYEALLRSHPRHGVVLRSYAMFAEDIQYDQAKADSLISNVDEERLDHAMVGRRRHGSRPSHITTESSDHHHHDDRAGVMLPPIHGAPTHGRRVSQMSRWADSFELPPAHIETQQRRESYAAAGLEARRETISGGPGSTHSKSTTSGMSSAAAQISQLRNSENRHSPLVRRMRFAIFGILLAALITYITLFIVAEKTIYDQFARENDDPRDAGQRHLFYKYSRMLSMALPRSVAGTYPHAIRWYRRQGYVRFAVVIEMTRGYVNEIREALSDLTQAGMEDTRSKWEEGTEVILLSNYTDQTTSSKTNLQVVWDTINDLTEVCNCQNSTEADGITCDTKTNYLVRNGDMQFLHSMDNIIESYKDAVSQAIDSRELIVLLSFWSCVGVFGLVILLVFVPIIISLRRERRGIQSLFGVVPKDQCLRLHRHFHNKGLTSGRYVSEGAYSRSRFMGKRGSLGGLPWRFMLTVVVLVGVATGLMIVCSLYIEDSRTIADELRIFSFVREYLYIGLFHQIEITYGDVPFFWDFEEQSALLKSSMTKLQDSWNSFLLHRDVVHRSAKLNEILEKGTCPSGSQPSLDCMSVNGLIAETLNYLDYYTTIPFEERTLSNPMYMETVNRVYAVRDALDIAEEVYKDYFTPRTDAYRTAARSIFGCVFVLIILLYLILLRQPLENLQEEHQTTRLLMLRLPLEVIMSIPAISDFISAGKQMDKDTIARSVAANEKKMQRILHFAADGFAEVRSNGTVAEFNLSAQKMFGYAADEIIGKNVELLFAQSEAEVLRREMARAAAAGAREAAAVDSERNMYTGLRKDGGTFTARVVIVFQKVDNESVYGLFLRDVTFELKQKTLLDEEKKKSNDLLLNILPHSVAERLKNGEEVIADEHADVTVLFTDIVGFTSYSGDKDAREVVELLRGLFTAYDRLSDQFKAMKIKTIGDAYLATMGLEEGVRNQPERMMRLAVEMIRAAHELGVQIRAGLHVGKVVAGVVGTAKMTYDIWGDTVNMASRMESTSEPGHIQVSRAFYEHVYDKFTFRERKVDVKGKGELLVYICLDEVDTFGASTAPTGAEREADPL